MIGLDRPGWILMTNDAWFGSAPVRTALCPGEAAVEWEYPCGSPTAISPSSIPQGARGRIGPRLEHQLAATAAVYSVSGWNTAFMFSLASFVYIAIGKMTIYNLEPYKFFYFKGQKKINIMICMTQERFSRGELTCVKDNRKNDRRGWGYS